MLYIVVAQSLFILSSVIPLQVTWYNKFSLRPPPSSDLPNDLVDGEGFMLFLPLSIVFVICGADLSLKMNRKCSSVFLIMFLLLQLLYTGTTILVLVNSGKILDTPQYNLLLAITVIQCLFLSGYSGYSRILLKEYGWKEYKIQGADKESLVMSRIYEFFVGQSTLSFYLYLMYFQVLMVTAHYLGQEKYSAILLFVVVLMMGKFVGAYGVLTQLERSESYYNNKKLERSESYYRF